MVSRAREEGNFGATMTGDVERTTKTASGEESTGAVLPPLARRFSRKRSREKFVRQFLRDLSGRASGLDGNRSNR
jgi:hypothetical protein